MAFMHRAILGSWLIVTVSACSQPRTVITVLGEAQAAMGDATTLQYVATGTSGWMGQAPLAGEDWPQRELTRYTRSINYEQRSASEDMLFTEAVFGGQQQNTHVNGDKAWNVGPAGPVPQLAAAEERQLQIWLTPHGFLKGALAAGDATFTEAGGVATVSFRALGKYPITGFIDAAHDVTYVATTVGNPVLGDVPLVFDYSDYQPFGAAHYPKRTRVTYAGSPLWDLTTTSVQTNTPFDLPVPQTVASATMPAMRTAVSKLADGVWFVGGGSHHSVVVEFADHLAVIEAPLSDERSLAVLAEAKKLVPGKSVKYLVTSHHHFDHTGGLRAYVAEGATIITDKSNVEYFKKAAGAPATIAPDTLAKSPKPPSIEGVDGQRVLTDGKQSIEIYATDGDTHTKEYTLVYLPGPKILVEADAFSPAAADAPPLLPVPPNAAKLFDDIQRLKLNVATIAPIHGRGPVPFAEFARAVGRR